MIIYRMLGIHENVLSSWSLMHREWRWKSKYSTGTQKFMRKTGEASTALGNLITNMSVHADYVIANWNIIELMLKLGDDLADMLNDYPNVKDLPRYTRVNFNMISKQEISEDYGNFC